MGKALLFDLDGTLLPMDTDAFVEEYMQAIVPHVKEHLEPHAFLKILWDGTKSMIQNVDPNLTNEQVFKDYFLNTTGFKEEEIWPTFDRFYNNYFPLLKKHTKPTPLSKEIVEIAKAQGRKVVIATNPVFPKAAIYERLKWLGLDEFPFDMVTVYENSHFCKPQAQYFQEILGQINVSPEEAVMIGNDLQEDMVASKIGMKTYLVTDYIIDRGNPKFEVNEQGSLEDLRELIQNEQGIFSFSRI